jgi:hypothetical protein
VHAKAAMDARALQAKKNAVRDRGPLRVFGVTVSTGIIITFTLKFPEEYERF